MASKPFNESTSTSSNYLADFPDNTQQQVQHITEGGGNLDRHSFHSEIAIEQNLLQRIKG
jgi:hypothetical protein